MTDNADKFAEWLDDSYHDSTIDLVAELTDTEEVADDGDGS